MNEMMRAAEAVWLDEDSCSLADFRAIVEVGPDPASVPLAAEIASGIPVYDCGAIGARIDDRSATRAVMAEWNRVFATGPGIIVLRGAYTDGGLLDDVAGALNDIMAREAAAGGGAGDHFAAAGANGRLWNAHEKLAVAVPELFVRYNSNPFVALASTAWLGPLYRITTQVNIVRPGGKAQTCHRDYHMGFQTAETLLDYPARQHALSAALTLQGAIAHCDMPLVSGPTKLLPHSQKYLPGYIATLKPEFRDYFERHHVQVPLAKGDALFFNPATFHAGGENRSADIQRFANLLQVSSAYGRAMEIVDHVRIASAVYPVLLAMKSDGRLSVREIADVIAASAEGYPFPANLDLDPPLGGLAPQSQQQLMATALAEGWNPQRFETALRDRAALKRSH
jgi:ectoine hydroxylase-related dioxygenase (phytanoyl-CoA dioxygenase family)